MEQMNGAEIFDVDHTITRNITSLSFLCLLIKKKVFNITILRYWPFLILNYRFGKMDDKHFNRKFKELEGLDRSFFQELANENFQNMLQKNCIFDGAKKYIEGLKKDGKMVILASSSVDIILKPLADYLGADAIIATKFAFKNDKCTGGFEGKVTFREEKRLKVLEFMKENNLSLKKSSFYSDSIHDYPMFLEVGNPVAANPDIRLKRYAKKSGWTILRFK